MLEPLIPVADARFDFGFKLLLRLQIQSFRLKDRNNSKKVTIESGISMIWVGQSQKNEVGESGRV